MFTKGFTINGKHSYADYGLYINNRVVGLPTKNSIRKTIPFMSGYYDLSRINGWDVWGERTLSYTFDIVGDTIEETDRECTRILNWLGNVHEADIYDDTMPEYHFHGSFSSASTAESEDGEKVELTVIFVCHPFKVANADTTKKVSGNFTLENEGQQVRLHIVASAETTVTLGALTRTIPAGETVFPALLPNGVVSGNTSSEVTLKWREEVL